MPILVTYNSGKITITGDGNTKTVDTSTFYGLNIKDLNADCQKNNNDKIFIDEQQDLRALDCMKDGSVARGPNIANQVYAISYNTKRTNLPFTTLHSLEEKIATCFLHQTTNYAWTKISKTSKLEPCITDRIIFKESGLDAEHFIDNPSFCGNFANEIIDPAGRSPIRETVDRVYPSNGIELILDETFLTLFGFIGCSVRATRIANQQYRYVITIPSLKPITAYSTSDNGIRVDWFQGNVEKNNFIQTNALNRLPNSRAIKNGLLMTKEMGDVLQVLIMFIWSITHNGIPYSMCTCDKVVFLQCMILNLNCILSSAIKEGGTKLRSIEHFEPAGNTIENSIYRFNKEKSSIWKENMQFLKTITHLLKNSSINIYVAGDNNPFLFTNEFYANILGDLASIQNILTISTGVDGLTTKEQVDEKLLELKSNFLFNIFIRKVNNKLIFTLAKNYTKKNILWNNKHIIELPQYGTDSIFSIGRKTFLVKHGGGIKQRGGSRELLDTEKGIFENLEFYEKRINHYDKDTNSYVDLTPTLTSQIRNYISQLGYADYYITFKSELYYNFYLLGAVLYDDELKRLIDDLIANDLALPSPIQSQLNQPLRGKRTVEPTVDGPTNEAEFTGESIPRSKIIKVGAGTKKQKKNNVRRYKKSMKRGKP